ncbi:MAG: type II toxin-antitoxin system RelE/ParE family toxin [Chloroflexi bacterium]|nr:type II toxin-antitoxin system RelE/ParE family toxin [Chloroflexota bacterium]
MSYRVEFKPESIDDLRHLDKAMAQRIFRKLKWFSENFDTVTPEPLTAELRGLFKLRVGSYRVIYEAKPKEHLLTIHFVGHRKEVYKRK